MYTSSILVVAFAALAVSPASAGVAREPIFVARDLESRTIPALLRSPISGRSAEGLLVRQTSCAVGNLPCSDGQGCCPIGEYCGEWGGKLGCCPTGKNCVANPNQECDFKGYSLCPGEDFCCPTGDTCSKDAAGAPQCLTGGGNGPAPTTTRTTSTPGASLAGPSSTTRSTSGGGNGGSNGGSNGGNNGGASTTGPAATSSPDALGGGNGASSAGISLGAVFLSLIVALFL